MVEDDPNDVFLLQEALKRAHVTLPVRVVPDGEQAIAYLDGTGPYADRKKHPIPCLVLLDIKLPKKNGLEVLRWLRHHEEHQDLPVLMISSSQEPQDREQASEHGVEAYRVKPVSFQELIRLAQDIGREADEHCSTAERCSPEDPSGSQ